MASKTKQKKQDTARAGKNNQEIPTKNGDASKGGSDMERIAQERKSYLQREYKIVTEHMNTYMGRMECFLQENKRLEKEAQQNQEEGNACLSSIKKHSQRCQGLMITLNDQNHADLSEAEMQREKLFSQYTEKEKDVRNDLMSTESKYSLLCVEVEDLKPFNDPSYRKEQIKKIKQLEKELLATKIQHSEETHKIKSRFLKAKDDSKIDVEQKIQALAQRAEAAAMQALIQHIQQVKAENRHLRQELLRLIQYSKTLQATEAALREQQEQLLREEQCIQGMARARRSSHQRQGHNASGQARRSHSRSRCAQ